MGHSPGYLRAGVLGSLLGGTSKYKSRNIRRVRVWVNAQVTVTGNRGSRELYDNAWSLAM